MESDARGGIIANRWQETKPKSKKTPRGTVADEMEASECVSDGTVLSVIYDILFIFAPGPRCYWNQSFYRAWGGDLFFKTYTVVRWHL